MRRGASPALAAGAALLAVSCGAPLMTLPSGPGTPADATSALSEATGVCMGVRTLSAEVAVGGSIRGERVRVRLLVGLAAPDAVRIEALAQFGQPSFVVAASGGEATVVLSDHRVLERGPSDDVLDALTGLPVDAAGLRPLFAGCSETPAIEDARRVGNDWFVVPDGTSRLYLHRDASRAPWRLVAVEHRSAGANAWRAEYRDFVEGLPQLIRLTSSEKARFDLRLALSQVAVNETLGDEVFRVRVPVDAVPITLDELRSSAPWAGTE
jgi:hypothetical protein